MTRDLLGLRAVGKFDTPIDIMADEPPSKLLVFALLAKNVPSLGAYISTKSCASEDGKEQKEKLNRKEKESKKK